MESNDKFFKPFPQPGQFDASSTVKAGRVYPEGFPEDQRLDDLTPEMKAEHIAHLQQLLGHPGWVILTLELNDDIAITEAKLHGEIPFNEHDTIQSLQRERLDRIELRDLPQLLIEEYQPDPEPEDE